MDKVGYYTCLYIRLKYSCFRGDLCTASYLSIVIIFFTLPAAEMSTDTHWRVIPIMADMSIFKCAFMNYISKNHEMPFHDLINPLLAKALHAHSGWLIFNRHNLELTSYWQINVNKAESENEYPLAIASQRRSCLHSTDQTLSLCMNLDQWQATLFYIGAGTQFIKHLKCR